MTDHLLTPANAAFIVIDYQPVQVGSIRSMDRRELVFNIVHTAKRAVAYKLPIVHSTVNVATGRNAGPIAPLMEVLCGYPIYDRTTINSWEDREFKAAVTATGRRKLIMTALWTEACLAFPALDALREGYEVYAVADAVGGTSRAAHEAALRRIEQAGAKLIRDLSFIASCSAIGRARRPCLRSWMRSSNGTAARRARRRKADAAP